MFKDFNTPGYLYCESDIGSLYFTFNKSNGRFLFSSGSGYVNVLPELNKITDESSETPFLEIGRCSPLGK